MSSKSEIENEVVASDSNFENIREWLEENFEPWETIKYYWEKTCSLRRAHILSLNFDEMLKKWPRYKKQIGYELVDIDFANLYPDANSRFRHFWPKYNSKILELALELAKSRRDKDAIFKFSANSSLEDEENNFAGSLALYAIFYMLPQSNRKSKQNFQKLFRKAEKGVKINDEIRKIAEKEAKNNKSMNPFIIYFENDDGNIYKFFVCINLLIYETCNITTALDVLMKAYFVFDLQYPQETVNVLTFIQHFFFQIYLDTDISSSFIMSLIVDVDRDRAQECEILMKNC